MTHESKHRPTSIASPSRKTPAVLSTTHSHKKAIAPPSFPQESIDKRSNHSHATNTGSNFHARRLLGSDKSSSEMDAHRTLTKQDTANHHAKSRRKPKTQTNERTNGSRRRRRIRSSAGADGTGRNEKTCRRSAGEAKRSEAKRIEGRRTFANGFLC